MQSFTNWFKLDLRHNIYALYKPYSETPIDKGRPMRISALILSLAVAFPVLADTVKLRDDAPDRHVVAKGDTLWDISAKFLKTPWKWP